MQHPTPPPPPGRLVSRRSGVVAALFAAAALASVVAIGSAVGFPPEASCVAPDGRAVNVSNAEELETALEAARAGQWIVMAAGTYDGTFVLRARGTASLPIVLCSAGDAVIDSGTLDTGYGIHITGHYWVVRGLHVRNANKGVVLDGATHNRLERLQVEHLGQEGVHLRTHSTDNVLVESWIHDTGLVERRYGEGVYIGSAESNWCRYTGCGPDRSDRNRVERNRLGPRLGAECVDIKEGTAEGTIVGNELLGEGITDADAWVDVKGNGYLIEGNRGRDAPLHGFQVNVKDEVWGHDTRFVANEADIARDGFAIDVDTDARRTFIACSNRLLGDGMGLSNLPCAETGSSP